MEQATRSGPRLPAGLVTFVMTDIEGSTRLFRDLGDDYVAPLETPPALPRRAFEQHGEVEVATEGDALVVAFGDAAEALGGCVDGQLALASHPWPAGATIRVRMGCCHCVSFPIRPTTRVTTCSSRHA